MRFFHVAPALLLLAACGSGSDDTFSLTADEAFGFTTVVATKAATLGAADSTILPSGQVRYEGITTVQEIGVIGSGETRGSAVMAVDFDSSELTGEAYNFYNRKTEFTAGGTVTTTVPVEGSLSFASTSVSTGAFPITVAGSVEIDGTPESMAAQIDARFIDIGTANADIIQGGGTVFGGHHSVGILLD